MGADPLAVRLLLSRHRVAETGIDVLGFLSQDDLTAELLRTKVLAAPSIGMESFGMVLTRAFACAVPVVASDIDGYRDVMTDETGLLVPPGEPAALAEASSGCWRTRRCVSGSAPPRARRRRALLVDLDRRGVAEVYSSSSSAPVGRR